jgi:hypothetical protein
LWVAIARCLVVLAVSRGLLKVGVGLGKAR